MLDAMQAVLVFGALLGIALGVLLGALFFQGACWLYNRVEGAPAAGARRGPVRDFTLPTARRDANYRPPRAFERYDRGAAVAAGVPQPSYPRALAIVLLHQLAAGLASAVVGVIVAVVGFSASADPWTLAAVGGMLSLPAAFVALAGVAKVMLPTSAPRALSVALLNYLFLAVVAVLSFIVGMVGYALLS